MTVTLHYFPLIPGTKRPAIKNWEQEATADQGKINKWIDELGSDVNWGIACGPSNLVVLDFDSYKEGVALTTDILKPEDVMTPSVYTAHGGWHLYYEQPEGVELRNARGTLPPGVDVRGHGGYVVAADSTLEDGGMYQWGSSLEELDPLPLPYYVLEMLAPKPQPKPLVTVEYSTPEVDEIRKALSYIPTEPGYDSWVAILMAVHSVYPDETGVAIIEEWSPGYKGEVAKKWTSFKRTGSGVSINTLFYIAKQHGYVPKRPHEATADATRAALQKVLRWVESPACPTYIREHATKRVVAGSLTSLLMVLLGYGIDRGSPKVYITCRTLGNTLGIAAMAVSRQLSRLSEEGMIEVSESDHTAGTTVDLSPLFKVTDIYPVDGVLPSTEESGSFHRQHIGDDAFASYPRAYAEKRRGRTDLLPSLGPTGLLLWGPLAHGGTATELAEEMGMGRSTIKKACERFVECGLATAEKVGRSMYYQLVDDAEELLDDVRPEMHTAYVGQFRLARNYASTADYAAFRLRSRKKMEPRDVDWWMNLRDENFARATIILDALLELGFDGRMKVGKEKAVKRSRKRFDAGEEWRTWGRPLFDNYVSLGEDISHEEKARLITVANVPSDLDKETYRKAYNETRERLNVMLMLSRKRVEYERTESEPSDIVATRPATPKLQMELAL